MTSDVLLQLSCLDASLAVRPVFQKFQTVVITSGTLSPIDLYPRILNFNPVAILSLAMTLTRCSHCPYNLLCKTNGMLNLLPGGYIPSCKDMRPSRQVSDKTALLAVNIWCHNWDAASSYATEMLFLP